MCKKLYCQLIIVYVWSDSYFTDVSNPTSLPRNLFRPSPILVFLEPYSVSFNIIFVKHLNVLNRYTNPV